MQENETIIATPKRQNKKRLNTKRGFNAVCLLISGLSVGWLMGLSVSPVIQTILTSLLTIVIGITSALAGISLVQTQDSNADGTPAKRRPRVIFDPLPIMGLALGIAMGSALGVYARTNNWLGPKKNSFYEEWQDTGLTKEEVTRRVFDSLYPPTPDENKQESSSNISANTNSSLSNKSSENSNSNLMSSQQNANLSQSKTEKAGAAVTTKSSGNPPPAVVKTPPLQSPNDPSLGVLFAVTFEQCKDLRVKEGDDLRREMAQSNEKELVRLAKNCRSEECLKQGVERVCAKFSK